MKRMKFQYPRLQRTSTLLAFAIAGMLPFAASAQYVSVYGGVPATSADVSGVANAGWTEYVLWAGYISSTGDLNLNGTALTTNGAYVGNTTLPNLAGDITTFKQGSVKRISLSIYPTSFSTIETLVNSTNTNPSSGPVGGTGTSSALYQTFAALKANLPIDAIDLDDETNYDASSVTKFSVMLAGLGYHVEAAPYENASYWTSLVSSINAQAPGTVDLIHLQAYSGGASNTPCSGWNFGSVPVIAGDWDQDSPATFQSKFAGWHSTCGTAGGFLYQYHDGSNGVAIFAAAIDGGIGQSVPAGVPNRTGIYTDGTSFGINGIGNGNATGLDGGGYAYSSSQLGTSVTWNGTTYTFAAANQPNVWSNTTIALPAGSYSTLSLLATGVQGNQPAQTFKVNYTDGTSTTITQSLSDWFSPQSYPGESTVKTMTYRDTYSGSTNTGTPHLYGYSFAINNAKTVASLELPTNVNVEVLAYALNNSLADSVPVTLSSSFNRIGMYNDGTTFSSTGGLDNVGDAYSAQLLGTSMEYNNALYDFGNANYANDISATGQTITLPAGEFSTLRLLGAAVNGSQASQTFTVTYTDGSKSTFTQGVSDWFSPQNYSGEFVASAMPYRDTYSGGRDSRTFNLYNYSFALNNTKTVQSVTLPNNANVQIMAMTLVP